ncbi:hypothetical protein SAMN02910414_02395 [Lachnobacterium bovis DSM 14045]|uniref:Uncharacterized protein n=2 Tax=Lachnobacterium bovis TaxID=140626 RepID=A0A1H3MSC7_9FIRM|nr:hypothetical protein SAMN02910414_02395 [Lachnobacterium bovis DSM 14045]
MQKISNFIRMILSNHFSKYIETIIFINRNRRVFLVEGNKKYAILILFLYIFLRTNNRELCLKKNMVKIFISIFLYEIFVMLIMLIFFIAPRESKEISVINLVVLLIINTLQLFMLAMISNMLVLFKSEVVCNLGNIILTTAPLVIVGALYEERKQWIIFAKWFPLNLGNYVYLNSMKENIISILLMIVINFVLYYATAYGLKKYELLE